MWPAVETLEHQTFERTFECNICMYVYRGLHYNPHFDYRRRGIIKGTSYWIHPSGIHGAIELRES
jgi:hypothetical protein